jgi:hypothetical protein
MKEKEKNKTKQNPKKHYQNTSQRVNVETCSPNSMKTYKYKQKKINYKGQKHKVKNCKCKAPKQDNYNQLQSTTKPMEKQA